MKIKKMIVTILAVNTMLFYGSKFLFQGSPTVLMLALNLLQILGLVFALIFLHKACERVTNEHRKLWVLLRFGVAAYLIGNVLWIIYGFTEDVLLFSDAAYFFWIGAYLFFLHSLISRIKITVTSRFNRSYVFNVVVFMITMASIKIHFLIEPIFTFSEQALLNWFMSLVLPVLELSMLFAIIILYYLIYKKKEETPLLLVLGGLFIHIAADSYYGYLNMMGGYYSGHPVGLLWLSAIWLVGFGGFYARNSREVSRASIKRNFEKRETTIPYISTTILLVLVFYSYNWEINALSFGLSLILIMIIIRQRYVLKENNKLIDEYRFLAHHDSLTGLSNRTSFRRQLKHQINQPENRAVGLLLMDLDRFKVVNDTLGHQTGDHILVKTAAYLREFITPDMQLFRLGGDEFAVVYAEASEKKCIAVAERLLRRFQKPFFVQEHEILVTASVGISLYPKHGETVNDLFKYADAAMYLAKDSGRNNYRFYDDALNRTMVRKMKIENSLRKGIEKNQFTLCYQPKVALDTKEIVGMEALLRWHHPELGWVSPAEFIPIAEETGSIVRIGQWVLRTACKQNKIWKEKGLPSMTVSVNVSVRQFQQGNLLSIIKEELENSQLDPGLLEIEITESIMQNTNKNVELLHQISDLGVGISIDDFGTGYSSLYVIQELPINTIKLDKSFIAKIHDKKQQVMINTIINMGKALDLNVVAEGIENENQYNRLLESNCSMGQGYLFSKPIAPKVFEELLWENEAIAVPGFQNYRQD
ncbi:putative bifunctional diguanylate cyclase/phosphodiesterase [Isachenkonia alkalipeptolytica]|uniref:putative bifunctional diguanylate cyclase/phosphodiesterase n=1 Tax=Isachenkonia alkalipeptolytica TaxID=2565777 RepID=UPI00136B3386|nr:EAL domain-containing protein [Isachenkonia alkalipeptolytica]